MTQDAATNPASELAAAARELLGKLAQPSTADPEHSADEQVEQFRSFLEQVSPEDFA